MSENFFFFLNLENIFFFFFSFLLIWELETKLFEKFIKLTQIITNIFRDLKKSRRINQPKYSRTLIFIWLHNRSSLLVYVHHKDDVLQPVLKRIFFQKDAIETL